MNTVYLHTEYDLWTFNSLRASFERNRSLLESHDICINFVAHSYGAGVRRSNAAAKAIKHWSKKNSRGDCVLFLSIDATSEAKPLDYQQLLVDANAAISASAELVPVVVLSDPLDLLSQQFMTEFDASEPVLSFSDFCTERAGTLLTRYLAQQTNLIESCDKAGLSCQFFNRSRIDPNDEVALLRALSAKDLSDLGERWQTAAERRPFSALEHGAIKALQSGFATVDNAIPAHYFHHLLIDRIHGPRAPAFRASSRFDATRQSIDDSLNLIDRFNAAVPAAQRLLTPQQAACAANDEKMEYDRATTMPEATSLDARYGQQFTDVVTRNLLETLSENLSDNGKIAALRIICEDLPSVYPRVDLRYWNAYTRALRGISDVPPTTEAQTVRTLRQQVHDDTVAREQSQTDFDDANNADAADNRRRDTVRIVTGHPAQAPQQRNRIFLHVGHTKTGSSYIQSVLASNRRTLQNNGIYYPLTAKDLEQAERGNVTCGNRSVLDDAEALQRAFAVDGSLLLSNESMWKRFSDPDFVSTMAEAARGSDRTVALFMCIRDPIAHNRSRYMQLSQTGIVDTTISEFFTNKAIRDQRSRFQHLVRLMEVCTENGFELTLLDYSEIRSDLLNVFCRFLGLVDGLELQVPKTRVNRSMGAIELGARRTLNTLYANQRNLPRDRNYLRDLIDLSADLPFSLPMPSAAALQQFNAEIKPDVDRINLLLPDGIRYRCESNERDASSATCAKALGGASASYASPNDEYSVDDDSVYGGLLVETIALYALDALQQRCDNDDRAHVTAMKNQLLAQIRAPESYERLAADLVSPKLSATSTSWQQRFRRLHKRMGPG